MEKLLKTEHFYCRKAITYCYKNAITESYKHEANKKKIMLNFLSFHYNKKKHNDDNRDFYKFA